MVESYGDYRSLQRHNYWNWNDREDAECERCGAEHDEVDQFELHHKDGDPTNGDPDNIAVLCRECHYRVHDREPPESLEEWKRRVERI